MLPDLRQITQEKRSATAVPCEFCGSAISRCIKFSASDTSPSGEMLKGPIQRMTGRAQVSGKSAATQKNPDRSANRNLQSDSPDAKRIVIVDDHPLFRKGLEELIHYNKDPTDAKGLKPSIKLRKKEDFSRIIRWRDENFAPDLKRLFARGNWGNCAGRIDQDSGRKGRSCGVLWQKSSCRSPQRQRGLRQELFCRGLLEV